MDLETLRTKMVQAIARRGVTDEAVLAAMLKIPRHEFVPLDKRDKAYEDRPLSIGYQQTISQPYMVALMTAALHLKKTDAVLEIGTGSGYQTAVLAQICREVYTLERIPELTSAAEKLFQRLGINNVWCLTADGTEGWPPEASLARGGPMAPSRGEPAVLPRSESPGVSSAQGAPRERLFDGIIVTAAATDSLGALQKQLTPAGRMVIPIGDFSEQVLTLITREENSFQRQEICRCVFVPLVGKFGLKSNE